MCNKGFTLAESILVLCLTSFLILLTTIHMPISSSLDNDMMIVKEQYLQLQLTALLQREVQEFQFTRDAFCTMEKCYTYAKGIHSDVYHMKFYENGTISQAKTICFYKEAIQKCFYIQLGSGQIDIR